MTDNFLHLTFSIFTYNDIVKFSDVVNELFLKQFQTGTAKMEQGNLCIDLYYNQIQGGLHKDIRQALSATCLLCNHLFLTTLLFNAL